MTDPERTTPEVTASEGIALEGNCAVATDLGREGFRASEPEETVEEGDCITPGTVPERDGLVEIERIAPERT